MKRRLLLLGVCLFFARPVSAQIIDHTTWTHVDQFTPEQIQAAQAMHQLTIGRSVGWNIDNGETCLQTPTALASSACRKNLLPSLAWTGSYPRPNWTTWYWPNLGLPVPVPPPCAAFSNGLWTGYQPTFLCFVADPQAGTWGLASFQFDYLVGTWSDSVANYFSQRTGNGDAYDFEQWRASLPLGQRGFLWTTSLVQNDSAAPGMLQRLNDFNVAARLWATDHQTPLLDLADLESHDQNGALCLYDGLPALCAIWAADIGHLNANGQIRAAMAVWDLAVALTASTPPPPPEDTQPPGIVLVCSPPVTPTGFDCTVHLEDNVGITRITFGAADAAGNTSGLAVTVNSDGSIVNTDP